MLLAGDVGGTKTLLGLFQRAPRRPISVAVEPFATNEFRTFTEMLDAFAKTISAPFTVEAAAIGVAGPVVDQKASLTNVIWDVSATEICSRFTCTRAQLLNDLEAMANSVEVLEPDEMFELQRGHVRADGNAVVIAAGTGLGEAYLHRVNGRLRPVPSEGGHADFAPRTDRELDLFKMLRSKYGRAEVEHVLCGPGLMNLYWFTHAGSSCPALASAVPGEEPAAVSRAALERSCPWCIEALDVFVSAYGSEAGNLALRGVATGGVFVGGGIAPKILELLKRGDFMDAFRAKGPMSELLSRIPVRIILNPEAGLLGAAVRANEMVS